MSTGFSAPQSQWLDVHSVVEWTQLWGVQWEKGEDKKDNAKREGNFSSVWRRWVCLIDLLCGLTTILGSPSMGGLTQNPSHVLQWSPWQPQSPLPTIAPLLRPNPISPQWSFPYSRSTRCRRKSNASLFLQSSKQFFWEPPLFTSKTRN